MAAPCMWGCGAQPAGEADAQVFEKLADASRTEARFAVLADAEVVA